MTVSIVDAVEVEGSPTKDSIASTVAVNSPHDDVDHKIEHARGPIDAASSNVNAPKRKHRVLWNYIYDTFSYTRKRCPTKDSIASTVAVNSLQDDVNHKIKHARGPIDAASSNVNAPKRKHRVLWNYIYDIFSYTPKRCRYNPDKPFHFSMGLNVLFGFAGCFTVANLYYTHPILNLLARDFRVTDEQASHIPTLAQAGYAAGLLFLCPPADLLKRRPFVLWLVWFTATMWIGLCVTNSYAVFCAITFITGVTTVTPQLMLPLIGDMAPPQKRALSLSIVVSGLVLGMLMARLLSGVVSRFIGWRYIYWISFALQYLILILLWLFMPDYPQTNRGAPFWKTYPVLLLDVLKMFFKHPIVAQACLIGLCTSSTFTSFWTTLTFLLAGPPYHYSSLVIGLFAVVGIGAMAWGPVYAKLVMQKHVPQFSVFVGLIVSMIGVVVGTYTGKFTVAGPIIQAACLDIGLQTSQIANRTAIYVVEPKARNRVNTTYMVCVFIGQLLGTAVGNSLYARGGWIVSGSTSVGFVGFALILCLARGPHEKGWIGWGGGYEMRLRQQEPANDNEAQSGQQKPTNHDTKDNGDRIRETQNNDRDKNHDDDDDDDDIDDDIDDDNNNVNDDMEKDHEGNISSSSVSTIYNAEECGPTATDEKVENLVKVTKT